MIDERKKEEIRGRWEEILSQLTRPAKAKVNGQTSYICPLCEHGKNGDGMTANPQSKDGNSLKCFGCGYTGDIIDLVGEVEGLTTYPEKVKRAGEYLGIDVQDTPPEPKKEDKDSLKPYYRQAHANLQQTDYLQKRGISEEVAQRFMLGYDPTWTHPKTPYAPETPRLIIPINEYCYIARDTREDIPAEQQPYKKSKAKSKDKVIWTFNADALKTARKPIVITEGEIDALSIIEVGGEAVAIGSVAYKNMFIDAVKKNRPRQPLLLALDNDKSGEKATAEIKAELKGLGFTSYQVGYYLFNGHKDANEALIADRESLKQRVQEAEEDPFKTAQKNYRSESAEGYLQGFINGIAESVDTPPQPTGFEALDKELDGGLYEGLYIVGAISSLGKTTFVMQVADQVAQSGQDVLIFSLEMARTELMSKSISRLTFLDVLANNGDTRNAKTARGITTGAKHKNYSQEENALIKRAINAYGTYAGQIYIQEGTGDIGADQVKEAVKRHITLTGNTPVVIVDYLQILAPHDVRASDKQNTDKAVLELKRLSRDYKTPVVAVSSLNRENYNSAIGMTAFKESGAIEYGSDVLIGLQLAGAGDKNFDSTEEKKKNPRKIELVIIKNRNGRTGEKIAYKYYPLFNYFEEEGKVLSLEERRKGLL